MRKPLLVLLGVACAAAATAVGATVLHEKIVLLDQETARYMRMTAQLVGAAGSADAPQGDVNAATVAGLQKQIDDERTRYYETGSITSAQFAATVQAELLSEGLTMLRYRPIEGKPGEPSREVEFAVRGPGEAVLAFLMHATSGGKYRYVRDVSIHALGGGSSGSTVEQGVVDATLRLEYEEIDDIDAH